MFEGFQIGFVDIVQIAILYVAIYALIRFIKGTRSAQMLLGFCLLVAALLLFTTVFRFDVLTRIVFFLLLYLALSLVVVFQQEIRRVLAMVGGQHLFSGKTVAAPESVPETLCKSVLYLSHIQLGGLIAVERGISLVSYEDSGVRLKALVSRELITSIFTPPLPLHDGGIIIRDGKIAAAHCVFPVSNQAELITSGMRHRAAVGLSEETDAVVIVVSEETGRISVAHNGRLHRYPPDKVEHVLLRWLKKAMPSAGHKPFSVSDWIAGRLMPYLRSLRPSAAAEEEEKRHE